MPVQKIKFHVAQKQFGTFCRASEKLRESLYTKVERIFVHKMTWKQFGYFTGKHLRQLYYELLNSHLRAELIVLRASKCLLQAKILMI